MFHLNVKYRLIITIMVALPIRVCPKTVLLNTHPVQSQFRIRQRDNNSGKRQPFSDWAGPEEDQDYDTWTPSEEISRRMGILDREDWRTANAMECYPVQQYESGTTETWHSGSR